MVDFGSPMLEKFPKFNDKTFFHSFNGFVFKKDQTLIKKNYYSDKNPKWLPMPKIKMASNGPFLSN
jgi:hypothetical protein